MKIYARYELWYTVIDVAAASCFLGGSLAVLMSASEATSTWLYLLGSVFFLAKPVMRTMREIRFLAVGDVEDLAKRAGWVQNASHDR